MKVLSMLHALLVLVTSLLLASSSARAGEPVMLGIVGYNYTNHYIDQFYVDGTGGGNIYVSTPTSGGGGTTCCVRYYPGSSLPLKIHVKWTDAACMFPELQPGVGSYIKPKTIERIKHFFKEADVLINGPIPAVPQNMEIHFYPDGRVEAAITAEYSPPRLRLEASREVEGYPACTPEQMATQDQP
ncbi:DUF3304 domain-containing protein [Herbaspirillum rubrisubalbicans]|uniref:DUF3304 domain-containing protein n=1 Tax=Herbaspirillum rubrisubalbicans TaxID=80842 RepID=UPI0015584CF9|nr:DUF3304 domain-containing protein [Herbaspirillum rubrisubalbicans]